MESLLFGAVIGALIAVSVIAVVAAWQERSDKNGKEVDRKIKEIEALKTQLMSAKGIVEYYTEVGWIHATRVSEREGRNTRFYMGDKIVASVPPDSSYCATI